jgi:hypothetical protein
MGTRAHRVSFAGARREVGGRPLSASRRLLTLLVATGALGAGCGNALPPIFTGENDSSSLDGGVSGEDGAIPSLTSDSGPPSCEAGTNGGVCGCLDLSLLADPPNLYFVLDRSGSMTDSNKWLTIRTVIADVMHRIGPRARFGAAIFPSPAASSDTCAAGIQVMPMTPGDAPAGTYGPATGAFTSSTNYPASGGTPTAATITALTSTLTALPGKTFVILATDGGPNCDSAVTCDSSACISNIESDPGCTPGGTNCCTGPGGNANCLDSAAAVQSITALAAAGVPTYVVGVPGAARTPRCSIRWRSAAGRRAR